MQETYRGHQITVTSLPRPNRVIGRHGATGKNWIVKVDDQDVTHKVLQLAIKDIESIIIAARKHIDKMTL